MTQHAAVVSGPPVAPASLSAVMSSRLRGTAAVTAAILFLVLPALVWIRADRSVWSWDPAMYGAQALRMARAAEAGIGNWLLTMFYQDGNPPLLVWLAQPFAFLHEAAGSVEATLLLVNVAALAGTLALVFSAGRRLGAPLRASAAGVFVVGGAALLIGLNQQFFVEPVQVLAVTVLLRAALEADRASLLTVVALAVFSVAVALLAKVTSIGFVLPFLFYMAVVRLMTWRRPKQPLRMWDYAFAGLAIVLLALTIGWYRVHWGGVSAHFVRATVSDVALYYGAVRPITAKFIFWVAELSRALTPWPLLAGFALTLVVAGLALAAARLASRAWVARFAELVDSGLLFALCLVGTILAGLFAYSVQINEDVRFLAPMLPLIGVLVAWSLQTIGKAWLSSVALLLFIGNAAAAHAHALGLATLSPNFSGYIRMPQSDRAAMNTLSGVVARSCSRELDGRWEAIGVSKADLNGNAANFYALKNRKQNGFACNYMSFEAMPDLQKVIASLEQADVDFIVTLPASRISQIQEYWANRASLGLADWLAANPGFERATGPEEPVTIFRKLR